MSATPTIVDIIRAAIAAALSDLHVAMPGRVIAYNADRETVDVVPQFRRALEDDSGDTVLEDLPNIPDVPICWPSGAGGSCFITWPLAKDDPVLLVFCERDPGMWRETGAPGTPGDLRAHGLSGAVAYPGLRPNGALLGSGARHATKLVLGQEVLIGSSAASEQMVLGTAFGSLYNAHSHPTPMGPSGAPVLPMVDGTHLSTKNKLDPG